MAHLRCYISDQVQAIIKKFKTSDPFEIIDALGIHLLFRNDVGTLKGFYYISRREKYIVINDNLHEREQLIVAAHELGHHYLHKELAGVAPLKDFMLYDMASRSEYDANFFAAELLMNDEDIENCISEDMDFLYMCSTLGFRPELVCFKLYGMMQRGYPINIPQNLNSKFLGK